MLVTFGDRDDVWPPALQAEMADRLGAPAVVLPDAGHSPAADLPEVTAEALLAFWAGIAGAVRQRVARTTCDDTPPSLDAPHRAA